MPKYLIMWELDADKVPIDPKERAQGWLLMTDMIKQDLIEGKDSDWGCFVGQTRGYAITEQSEIDVMKDLQRFFPLVRFEAHQVVSIDDIATLAKSMME
ncbi:MAG: hypothetical protein JSW16_02010 [Dehalococcoidales bacterium]|nr:MAG: hypothetical protein JSW16_02010 [Dehalococcoidales bacterium]